MREEDRHSNFTVNRNPGGREEREEGREGGREGERERDGFFVSAPHQPISAWAPIVLGGVLRPQFCNASN